MHLHVFRPCHSLNALPWPDPKKKKIVCAIQYSLAARDIATNIKKHGHIIQTDPTLKKLFTTPEWCTKDPQPSPTHFLSLIPSGNYRCHYQCHFTYKTSFFDDPDTGKKIQHYRCHFMLYCQCHMLKCPCRLAYAGKTTRPLRTRIAERYSTIWNNVISSPVTVHFSVA